MHVFVRAGVYMFLDKLNTEYSMKAYFSTIREREIVPIVGKCKSSRYFHRKELFY